ncbi:jg14724 [Pararge aegeria aegeria]|uniref:Jg14724 protein n=2 Tax=Pararge aegeria TaxID=116150 RepID=A0A8S4SKN3_9NEOP|nr:jg14724 [Pararge aegeria aegeria]
MGTNIYLNQNKTPLVSKFNDLQLIFMDPACRGCYICMEKALNAHKPHTHMMDPHISSENFQDDRNIIDVHRRDKRQFTSEIIGGKKSKRSKSKNNKAVTLMKYKDKGKIYALKIKETNSVSDLHNKSKTVTTCQVYSIQKSFSCESPQANLILTDTRKKTNKKGKKGHGKRETKILKPIKTVITPVMPWKRYIDDSHVLEQIMPSIEEIY